MIVESHDRDPISCKAEVLHQKIKLKAKRSALIVYLFLLCPPHGSIRQSWSVLVLIPSWQHVESQSCRLESPAWWMCLCLALWLSLLSVKVSGSFYHRVWICFLISAVNFTDRQPFWPFCCPIVMQSKQFITSNLTSEGRHLYLYLMLRPDVLLCNATFSVCPLSLCCTNHKAY